MYVSICDKVAEAKRALGVSANSMIISESWIYQIEISSTGNSFTKGSIYKRFTQALVEIAFRDATQSQVI